MMVAEFTLGCLGEAGLICSECVIIWQNAEAADAATAAHMRVL